MNIKIPDCVPGRLWHLYVNKGRRCSDDLPTYLLILERDMYVTKWVGKIRYLR